MSEKTCGVTETGESETKKVRRPLDARVRDKSRDSVRPAGKRNKGQP